MRTIRAALLLPAFLLLGAGPPAPRAAAPDWLDRYTAGVALAERGNHQEAALEFLRAIRIKDRDNDRERLSGMRTVEYFPHRELGIALLDLDIHDYARRELTLSLEQKASDRARQALGRVPR